MTLKPTLVTAIVGSALVLGVPVAWGQSQPVSPDVVERAVLARELSSRLDANVYRDAFERTVVANRRGVGPYVDAHGRALPVGGSSSGDRSIALNRMYGLGEFATQVPASDAFERAAIATERRNQSAALGDRSIALNRMYGLGEFATASTSDSHDRISPVSRPISTPVVTSGRDIDWPQVGIGFGVGILLALGLLMTMRLTRIRPLAH